MFHGASEQNQEHQHILVHLLHCTHFLHLDLSGARKEAQAGLSLNKLSYVLVEEICVHFDEFVDWLEELFLCVLACDFVEDGF